MSHGGATLDVCCAQCGREPLDARELERWRPGDRDVPAPMLLCPDCAEEDRLGDYEVGVAD